VRHVGVAGGGNRNERGGRVRSRKESSRGPANVPYKIDREEIDYGERPIISLRRGDLGKEESTILRNCMAGSRVGGKQEGKGIICAVIIRMFTKRRV